MLTFQALPYREPRDDVRFAEEIGIHAAWLADQAVSEHLPVLEAWTSLAALAADTVRIRLGTLITNAAIWNAMLLARQALTVDQISQSGQFATREKLERLVADVLQPFQSV